MFCVDLPLDLDLPLTMTIDRDMSAVNSGPETLVVIRLRSSMKAHSKGNVVLLVVNLRTLACIEYSSLMLGPSKKRIIDRVRQVKTPCYCRCQVLIADSEHDLLKFPL